MSKQPKKDICLVVPGESRDDLEAVQKNYPVAQVTIVAAAMSIFRRLPIESQGEEIRRVDQIRRRRRAS